MMAEGDRPGAQGMLEYVRSDAGSAAANRAAAVLEVVASGRYQPPPREAAPPTARDGYDRAFLELAAGRPSEARRWLRWVVDAYPGDPAAAAARSVLEVRESRRPPPMRDEPQPQTRWYVGQMGALYGISVGALVLGASTESPAVSAVGGLGWLLGAPLLHLAHGSGGAAAGSAGLRVLYVGAAGGPGVTVTALLRSGWRRPPVHGRAHAALREPTSRRLPRQRPGPPATATRSPAARSACVIADVSIP
jgi:hypothetical protein